MSLKGPLLSAESRLDRQPPPCRAALVSALHAVAPRSHTGELIVEPWHASC